MPVFLESLLNHLLGRDKRRRAGLVLTCTAVAIYAFSLLVEARSVRLGFADGAEALALAVLIGSAQLVFYVLIRSGWSARRADPSLALWQMAFGIVALAGAYLINAHVRGMLLMLVALVLAYGSFTLTPRACRSMGWLAVGLLGAVMALGALRDPARFPPMIEAIHFAFSAVVLPMIGHLSALLSKLRMDLREQRQELRAALERLNRVATIDELTGLPNRRCMLERIPQEVARCQREGRPLAVALIDLDHFKRINDQHGHAVGDEVLRHFAAEAQQALRAGDTLARWGGEEFLLLMPDCAVDTALVVLDRLRSRLAQAGGPSDAPDLAVTFSAGVVRLDGLAMLDHSLRRADEALYAAKHQGRDRILTA